MLLDGLGDNETELDGDVEAEGLGDNETDDEGDVDELGDCDNDGDGELLGETDDDGDALADGLVDGETLLDPPATSSAENAHSDRCCADGALVTLLVDPSIVIARAPPDVSELTVTSANGRSSVLSFAPNA